MLKYKTHQSRPLQSKKPYSTISKVQSNLQPTLRNIVTSASPPLGLVHSVDNNDYSPNYDRLSFLERYKRYNELKQWYEDNREVCDRVNSGDFSDFKEKPAEPIHAVPPADSSNP